MSWFLGLALWWKIAIIWGYFIIGLTSDLIQQKIFDWGDGQPAPILWFLWPLAMLLFVIFLPFILLAKLFGKI